jgi:small subunit ribosomal protein S4e
MTLKINIETAKVVEFIKFDIVMVTGGHNRGCIGVIQHHKKHKGSFDAIHVVDAACHQFTTWMVNVFTIGQGTKPCFTLPQGKGIKPSIVDEAKKWATLRLLLHRLV